MNSPEGHHADIGTPPADGMMATTRVPDPGTRDEEEPMGSCVIVASRTIRSPELAEAVHERVRRGDTDLVLVVPPEPSTDTLPRAVRMTPERSSALGIADGRKLAEQRLADGLDWLTELGANPSGEVPTDPDVAAAVREIAGRRQADEIVVSALPSGFSRFLRQDLPSRIRRSVSIPVTVVAASER